MTFQTFAQRTLFVTFLALLLIALWFFRDTLLLAFLAVVIAVGVSVPAGHLRRRGLSRGLANTLAAVTIGVVLLVLLLWLLPTIALSLGTLMSGLPQGLENLADVYNGLLERSSALASLLPPLDFGASEVSEEEVRRLLEGIVNAGLPILVSGGSFAFSLLANLVLVIFLALLFLSDPAAYIKASFYLTPKPQHARVRALWLDLYQTLTAWLSSLFTSITITVGLVLVVLGLLGMPNVLVVAVFAGFATFVPNIGAFLPLIPIAIFTLAENPASIFVMVPAYLAIQLAESNVLTPMIVKRQLSIPAAGMLLFQIVAGLVFGLLGILLAVPLLAVAITLVRELYSYGVLGLRGERVEVAANESDRPGRRKQKRSAQRARGTTRQNGEDEG